MPNKLARGLAKYAASGCLVKPLFLQWMQDDDIPMKITVTIERPRPRPADGWFHASSHPLMTHAELYAYLTRPVMRDPMDYVGRMSVMFGSLSHGVIEAFLDYIGVAVPLPDGDCVACGRPLRPFLRGADPHVHCSEHAAVDERTRSRCHMDSITHFNPQGTFGFDLKCLAAGTQVSMADGTTLDAGKVSEGDLILGWDESTQQLVSRRVKHVWDNGIVPVLKVRTRGGRELVVTDEHPFLTKRGWVRAEDLIPFSTEWKHGRNRPAEHDTVRTAWGSSWWSGAEGDTEQAALLGLLVGDGGLSNGRPNLTNADPGVINFAGAYAERLGCKLMPTAGPGSYYISAGRGANRSPVLELLRREGLLGKGAHEKQVPPSVWTGGPAAWAAFLSGYLDADGSVRNDPGSYPLVKWASVNRSLLLECQVLLSYLGIKSSVNIHRSVYKGAEHISWTLWVRDARSVARAQQVLRPHHTVKREALQAMSPAVRTDGRFVRDNMEWDPVVEVSRQIARPTIAIEVEGHTHVTAGLITHNSIKPWGSYGLKGAPDMDLEYFIQRWPHYHAQMNECMRLSGLRKYIVFFMSMGNPWELREYHVPFDPALAAETEAKYLAVLDHVARKMPILL